jgi:hypothetical protein
VSLARITGALVMLVPMLAACSGHDETELERQVRTYLEANRDYHAILGAPDNVPLNGLTCGKPGRFAAIACEITLGGVGTERYLVGRTPGNGFAFNSCARGIISGGPGDRGENDPCEAAISR